MSRKIVEFHFDVIKKWFNEKVNPINLIKNKLDERLNQVRDLWFDYVKSMSDKCAILTNIRVKFGLIGYKIVHLSGERVIAYKPYFINRFKLKPKNILKVIFKVSSIDIDFEGGRIIVDRNIISMTGKPIGMVIDYNKQRIVFVMSNIEFTEEMVFGIGSCLSIIRAFEKELFSLIK